MHCVFLSEVEFSSFCVDISLLILIIIITVITVQTNMLKLYQKMLFLFYKAVQVFCVESYKKLCLFPFYDTVRIIFLNNGYVLFKDFK